MTKRAAILSLTDPYAKRDGGTQRTRAMIGALGGAGFDVTCVHPHGDVGRRNEGKPPTGRMASARATASSAKRHLLPLPTEFGQRSTALHTEIDAIGPSLTVASILSQAQFANPGNSIFWLDFMDIWSESGRREASQRSGAAKLTTLAQSRSLELRENRYCKSAQIVTAAGWGDWRTLVRRGHSAAVWLPNPIADSEFEAVPRCGSRSKVAGLLGNFDYWPNREAYQNVVEHWLPILIDRGWTVLVAGVGSETLDSHAGVTALGMVDDLRDYYSQIDVTLAPINLGGGMKVKVLESFSRGVPVVGTCFAFDGFPDNVRAMGVTVELKSPDLGGLGDLGRLDPSCPALGQFTVTSFDKTVVDILTSK